MHSLADLPLNLPALQNVQVAFPGAENLPAAQPMQSPSDGIKPASHWLQLAEPTLLRVPLGQARHIESPESEKDPAGHGSQRLWLSPGA